MPNYNIAKRNFSHKEHFECEMCGEKKFSHSYEYKATSFVRRYVAPHLKKICADCIYRECFGSKNWRKKKKEGVLDEH